MIYECGLGSLLKCLFLNSNLVNDSGLELNAILIVLADSPFFI